MVHLEDDVMIDPQAEEAAPTAEEPTPATQEALQTQEPPTQVAEEQEAPLVSEVLQTVTKYGSVDVPQDLEVASHNVAPVEITRMEASGRRSHVQAFAKGSGLSTQQLL